MGCGYCVLACPYEARAIVPEPTLGKHGAEELPKDVHRTLLGNIGAGVATKCNMCLPRLEEGLRRGLRPGLDKEATPACAVSCLPGAVHFGDADDPESEVAQLLRDNKWRRIHEELGTAPSVYYVGADN
jgi:phenylacetyl-CoA:acceptor oxidoreductase subunit 1